MADLHLIDHAGLDGTEYAALAAIVARHFGLDDIFAWGRAQSPAVHPEAVIKQDEFTHDVLVPLPSGRWLVYGTTWLGAVKAVSVWDHRPSAEEILEKRLQAGWQPTPSELQHGSVVEGYAACVFKRDA